MSGALAAVSACFISDQCLVLINVSPATVLISFKQQPSDSSSSVDYKLPTQLDFYRFDNTNNSLK